MSSSAHSFNIGPRGPTGVAGGSTVLKGHTGPLGPTGNVGSSGHTGSPGVTIAGVTYSSTGPNAHHLIVQYANGLTSDGGFFRGPTGGNIHFLFGENIGSPSSTAGVIYNRTDEGIMYLKSITGGGGVEVIQEDNKIKIKYKTHDAVQVKGSTGQLVFFNKDSAGGTGLSGATLTSYQAGPTYSISVTTNWHTEVSGKVAPCRYECRTNTLFYNIDPIKLGNIDSARNNTSLGNYWMINAYDDYTNMFGGPPSDDSLPFIKINDCSPRDSDYVHYAATDSTVDLYFIVDKSSSMDDVVGTCPPSCWAKWSVLVQAIVSMLDNYTWIPDPYYHLGLISFEGVATHDVSLTQDRNLIKTALSEIEVHGSTNFNSPLALAIEEFLPIRRTDAVPVIIFLSDGSPTYEGQDGLPYAQQLKNEGVVIFTIGIGQEANSELLKQIASSDDHYYYATGYSEDYSEIFWQISQTILGYTSTGDDLIDPNTARGFTLVVDPRITHTYQTTITRPDCSRPNQIVSYPYNNMFPPNWKFPYNAQANTPLWANFITLGDIDINTNQLEWYGMVTRKEDNEWSSPFGPNQPEDPYSD